MIVITGGRGSRSSSSSSNVGSAFASSAAVTISICFSNSSAITWMVSSASVWVSVAISPRPISFLMTSGTATPRYSATSLTVDPELTRMTSAFSELVSCATGSSYVPRRRRPPRRRGGRFGPPGPPGPPPGPTGTAAGATGTARGLRVDDDATDAAAGTGRSALQARPRGPALTVVAALGIARARLGLGLRLGLGRRGKVLRARGAGGAVAEAGTRLQRLCSGLLGGSAIGSGGLGLGLTGERSVGELLVHGGRGSLHVKSVRIQALDDLRERHRILLG